MAMNQTISEKTGALYYGTDEGVAKLMERALPVAFPQTSIDQIHFVETDGEFRTYGPVGGNDIAYRAIAWAYEHVAAFGVHIDRFGDDTYPVLLLSSHRALKAMVAHLNDK